MRYANFHYKVVINGIGVVLGITSHTHLSHSVVSAGSLPIKRLSELHHIPMVSYQRDGLLFSGIGVSYLQWFLLQQANPVY